MDNLVISGKPSIVIRCGCDFSLRGKEYKQGQIVSIINDCDTDFNYRYIEKNITHNAATIGYGEDVELSNIIIYSAPFNKMLYDLVFSGKKDTLLKPNAKTLKSNSNGIVAIPTSEEIFDVQVYNDDFNFINFTLGDNNTILITPDTQVKVVYYTALKDGITMKTSPESLPYFTLEILNKGNSIGETERTPIIQYMKLNKCGLKMEPYYLYNDSINSFDLRFKVIKDNRDIIGYGQL